MDLISCQVVWRLKTEEQTEETKPEEIWPEGPKLQWLPVDRLGSSTHGRYLVSPRTNVGYLTCCFPVRFGHFCFFLPPVSFTHLHPVTCHHSPCVGLSLDWTGSFIQPFVTRSVIIIAIAVAVREETNQSRNTPRLLSPSSRQHLQHCIGPSCIPGSTRELWIVNRGSKVQDSRFEIRDPRSKIQDPRSNSIRHHIFNYKPIAVAPIFI